MAKKKKRKKRKKKKEKKPVSNGIVKRNGRLVMLCGKDEVPIKLVKDNRGRDG